MTKCVSCAAAVIVFVMIFSGITAALNPKTWTTERWEDGDSFLIAAESQIEEEKSEAVRRGKTLREYTADKAHNDTIEYFMRLRKRNCFFSVDESSLKKEIIAEFREVIWKGEIVREKSDGDWLRIA